MSPSSPLSSNGTICISPNGGFLTQIKEYEAIYRASQAVAAYPTAARGVARRKRDDEDDDEDEREEKRAILSNEPEPSHDPNAMETS
ncbi:hypothetical protein H0H93_016392 [Arthromyces matolae]|nr:hypothetical protein H0H93_016392 [Arthromyces matolae]